MEEKRIDDKKRKRKKQLLWIIVILLLLLSIGGCEYYRRNCSPCETPYEDVVDEIKDIDLAERQAQVDQVVEEGMFRMKLNPFPTFENGITRNIHLQNPASNNKDCKFKILLEGEIIYESDYFAPGKQISSLQLTRQLTPGTYDAVGQYVIRASDNEENTTNVDMKLNVK